MIAPGAQVLSVKLPDPRQDFEAEALNFVSYWVYDTDLPVPLRRKAIFTPPIRQMLERRK